MMSSDMLSGCFSSSPRNQDSKWRRGRRIAQEAADKPRDPLPDRWGTNSRAFGPLWAGKRCQKLHIDNNENLSLAILSDGLQKMHIEKSLRTVTMQITAFLFTNRTCGVALQ